MQTMYLTSSPLPFSHQDCAAANDSNAGGQLTSKQKVSAMAWAGFQVLSNRCVMWEQEDTSTAGKNYHLSLSPSSFFPPSLSYLVATVDSYLGWTFHIVTSIVIAFIWIWFYSFHILILIWIFIFLSSGGLTDQLEHSGLARQVSSLLTNHLARATDNSANNAAAGNEALQEVLSLLNNLARSRMGKAILSQPDCVSKLLSLLLDQR